MLNKNVIEEINSKISEILQHGPAKDIEKNIKVLLSGAFSRLDLVTREEFDVQQELLHRTREKLVKLEAKIAALENHIGLTTPESAMSEQPAPANIE